MNARPIGYVAADVDGLSPTELVQALAEAGYDAVDWTMEQWDPLTDGTGVLCELVDLASESGLASPQLMVHQDYVVSAPDVWEERVRRTEVAIDAAATAGIPTVGIVTGPNRWVPGHTIVGAIERGADMPEAEAWEAALSAIKRVLPRASDSGVRLCLEPCWGTLACDRYRAEYVFARLGPLLGVTIDPSHFVMSGDDVSELVHAWRDRLAHVHLKDAVGRPGIEGRDFWFMLPGAGATDWSTLFRALDDVDYTGAMSVEFESFGLRTAVFDGSVDAAAGLTRTFVDGLLRTYQASRDAKSA